MLVTASNSEGARKKKKPPEPVNLPQMVWPLPPEQPRIKFLNTYSGELDFEKKESLWSKALLGPKDIYGKIQLVKPLGIVVDSKGVIYVGDAGQGVVIAISPMEKSVWYVGERGGGSIGFPTGLAVDDDDNLYVSDTSIKKVLVFNPDGKLIFSYGEEGDFVRPAGIAIDNKRELIYVVDVKQHCIRVFKKGHANFWKTIGERGNRLGQFNFPTFIAINEFGELHITDAGNFRIQILDKHHKSKFAFGKVGRQLGNFSRPKGIALDSEGHIYVADAAFNNFQIFDNQGKLLLFVGQFGYRGLPAEFNMIADIFIDKNDRIFTTDQLNHRVQVFQFIKSPD